MSPIQRQLASELSPWFDPIGRKKLVVEKDSDKTDKRCSCYAKISLRMALDLPRGLQMGFKSNQK